MAERPTPGRTDRVRAIGASHETFDDVRHERDETVRVPGELLQRHHAVGQALELQVGSVRRAVVQKQDRALPADWFAGGDPPEVYVEYLERRLASGGFVEEAERARAEW